MEHDNQGLAGSRGQTLHPRPDLARAQEKELSQQEVKILLHDLSVYQVELETQNEQLRQAQRSLQITKNRYFNLYRNIPVGYVTLDSLGIIRECNNKFLALVDRAERRVVGRTVAEFIDATNRNQFDLWVKSGSHLTTPMTFRFNCESTRTLFVSIVYSELEGAAEVENMTVVTCTDVTVLKVAEDRVRLSAVVFESASEGTLVTDAEQRIILVNPAFTHITGYTPEEVLGKTPRILNSGKHDPEFYRQFWQALNASQHWEGEVWNRKKNGEIYPEWLTVNVLKDHYGQPNFYVAVFREETERKQAEEIIRKQATHDSLTGLPNRILFTDRLEHEMRNTHRTKQRMCLVFLDLDGFKDVNDRLGHGNGDKLLIEVARRLLLCVRDTDTVARLGGDEFALILPSLVDDNRINQIAEHILSSLAEPFDLGGAKAYITASIGMAMYPGDALNPDDLIKSADQAMYEAKNAGKNRYCHFTVEMQMLAKARYKTIADLRLADIDQAFMLHYQPIVDLASGAITKAEGLLRWQHPEDGLLTPGKFITLAEETGMIMRLGDRVFRNALADLQDWREFDPDFKVSINVSPVQFRDGHAHLREWLELLKPSGIPGSSLIVEITESLLLDRTPIVDESLLAFRDAGIEVALDDFGTGYSSLSYLKRFDIDYLKIDQSFTRNLAPDNEDRVLCEAIVVMAHKLGLKVVAEGVETEMQRDLLREIGCDYGQGYLFSKPIAATEFSALLRQSQRK